MSTPKHSLAWLGYVEALCRRTQVARPPFELLSKPLQSFLFKGLSPGERAGALQAHFGCLETRLGVRSVGRLIDGGTVAFPLGPPDADPDAPPLVLTVGRSAVNRREGDLHLSLIDGVEGRRVASLAFVFGEGQDAGRVDLMIGGLQGAQGPDAKALTIGCTKRLSGLRPKDLLLHAAYGLADRMRAAEILAVSNVRHVHAAEDGPAWPFDYDAFWRERGAVETPSGLFRLPRSRPRRDAADVPTAKRKAWRARYALIDRLGAQIAAL